jgi:hypothetical protein
MQINPINVSLEQLPISLGVNIETYFQPQAD